MATSPDLAEQTSRAGQQIIAAPALGVAEELNKQLNQMFGWPFRAASGKAFDSANQSTAPFGTLIFTRVQGATIPEGQPVNVAADTLACVIDVTPALDVEGLRQA